MMDWNFYFVLEEAIQCFKKSNCANRGTTFDNNSRVSKSVQGEASMVLHNAHNMFSLGRIKSITNQI